MLAVVDDGEFIVIKEEKKFYVKSGGVVISYPCLFSKSEKLLKCRIPKGKDWGVALDTSTLWEYRDNAWVQRTEALRHPSYLGSLESFPKKGFENVLYIDLEGETAFMWQKDEYKPCSNEIFWYGLE